jgi:DNA replication protein DnaC
MLPWGVERAIAAIHASIANSWQGIFEEDKRNGHAHATPPETNPQPSSVAASQAPADQPPKSSSNEKTTMSEADAEKIIQDAAAKSHVIAASRAAEPIGVAAQRLKSGIRIISDEEAKRMQELQDRRERAERVAECHRLKSVPDRYVAASFDDVSRIPADTIDKYLRVKKQLSVCLTKPGLYALCGEIGDGKTHLACALINAFCDQGRSARYLKTMDYVDRYRATWKMEGASAQEQFESKHVKLTLLVLDEWQVRRGTEDENFILLRLLDKRYDAGKTTVLVSNHKNSEEFDQSIDARIQDRICDGGGAILCDWPSLRGRLGAQ